MYPVRGASDDGASQGGDPRRGWLARLVVYTIVSFIASLVCGVMIGPLIFMNWLDADWQQLGDSYREIVNGLARGEPYIWAFFVVPAAVVAVVQAVFLLPLFRPPLPGEQPKSLRWSAACAGFIAAAALAGLAWTILELITWDTDAIDAVGELGFFGVAVAAFVPGWVAWAWVLGRRSERADPLGLDRMLLPLLVGTGLAVALMIPLDALVRRKKDCYCATGSFWGLCIGIAACVWFLGPCLLLGLSRERRRWARRRACLGCGYERRRGHGGARSERCPECGRAWTRRRGRKATASQ
ncbi:MAG: hypothetical protein U0572_10380 [Phycisphaerales bacterium]